VGAQIPHVSATQVPSVPLFRQKDQRAKYPFLGEMPEASARGDLAIGPAVLATETEKTVPAAAASVNAKRPRGIIHITQLPCSARGWADKKNLIHNLYTGASARRRVH
jgi:hypothetical protein